VQHWSKSNDRLNTGLYMLRSAVKAKETENFLYAFDFGYSHQPFALTVGRDGWGGEKKKVESGRKTSGKTSIFVLLFLTLVFLGVGCAFALARNGSSPEVPIDAVPLLPFDDASSAPYRDGTNTLQPSEATQNFTPTQSTSYLTINDSNCVGYDVYVNGIFQFTEGGDGYCGFYIPCAQNVIIELKKNGCSISKTRYAECGVSYYWEITENWCTPSDVTVTDVKIIRGEFDVNGWFQAAEAVDEVRIGDVFIIEVNVTNDGGETEPIYNLYSWEISPSARVKVIGNASTCLAIIWLGTAENATLIPFCLSQAFYADEEGVVSLDITVKDWNDLPVCEHVFEFEIEGACMNINTSGYYSLTTDIINSSAHCCINITASDVIFDGMGHLVDGVDAFDTYGVCAGSSTSMRNVTVTNVTVTDWGYSGIYFGGVEDGRIEQCTASSNDYGIVLFGSTNNTVINNTASSNTDGIYSFFADNNTILHNFVTLNYGGIGFSYSSNNTVCNNTAEGNYFGIDLYQNSNNNSIAYNTIHNSYDTGIYLSASHNNTMHANDASDNNVGINLSTSHYNNLTSNTASNCWEGIVLWHAANNSLIANTALDNFYGIRLLYSNDTTITRNEASGNDRGIQLDDSANNTIEKNTLSNVMYGVYIIDSNRNTVSTNFINDHFDTGIAIQWSDQNTIINNTVENNTDGIYLSYSNDNLIYNNRFNNTDNFVTFGTISDSQNTWNTTKTPGTNILEGNHLGGNAWLKPEGTGFSQTCCDADVDRICDEPHELNTYNIDYLPLKAPTPVSACMEINKSGNYVLTRDLECAADCIRITTSDVVLDGDGHTINCTGLGTNVGVYVYNESTMLYDVTVKDLTVTNFWSGIHLRTVSDCSVRNVRALKNDDGIFIMDSDNLTVSYNTVAENLEGIFVATSNRSTLSYNNVFANTGIGIDLNHVSSSTISHNNASHNEDFGLFITVSCNNTLTNNAVEFNQIDGLYFDPLSTGNEVNKNILCYNNQSSGSGYFRGYYDLYDGDANCGCNNTCETYYNWNDTGASGCTYSNCWYRQSRSPRITNPQKDEGLDFAVVGGLVDIGTAADDPLNDLLFLNLTLTRDSFFHEIPLSGTKNGGWNWSGTWNTTEVAEGEYLMTATTTYETENFGLVHYSTELPVIVDNTPPIIAITEPLDGATISDLTLVEAEASDANGIDRVNFSFNNSLIATDTNETNGWFTVLLTTKYSDGTHILQAEAVDLAGNVNCSEISVTVANPDIHIQNVTAGGPYKCFVIGENEANITVTLNNTGLANGAALVRLEWLPAEVGKQIRIVEVPAGENATTHFKFPIFEYDRLDGWIFNGFWKGMTWYFIVNVTDVIGSEVYDSYMDKFIINEGPSFWCYERIIYTSDEDWLNKLEVGEYFLLELEIWNHGDENVSYIYTNSGLPQPFAEGFCYDELGRELLVGNSNGLSISDYWETGHMESCSGMNYSESEVAELYQWEATRAGVARLNFDITYKDEAGIEHKTVLYEPLTFSIYSHNKTLIEPQSYTDDKREINITVWGVNNSNVAADIKNEGNVYYIVQINGEPTDFWGKLSNFVPPNGRMKQEIAAEKIATNYKFDISYYYSDGLNILDGLLIAISPALPFPLDEAPVLIELLLLASKDSAPPTFEKPEEFAMYILDKLISDDNFRTAVIDLAKQKYGEEIGEALATTLAKEALALPKVIFAAWKISCWAVFNWGAPTSGTFTVTVADPPTEYTVSGEPIVEPLFFGGLSTVTSSMGAGTQFLSLNEQGEGEYRANYEIDTSCTSLNDTYFDLLSMMTITETGKRNASVVEGNVTIRIYPMPDSVINLSKIFLADTGFAESLVESYVVDLERFESRLAGDHVELRGRGELHASSYDDELTITTIITEETVNATFYQRGRYAAVTGGRFQANISFGPRFNIPLNNTRLTIAVPYENMSVSPSPDYTDAQLHWDETPAQVNISFSLPSTSFDTGPGTYPGIAGTHNGTLTPNQTITVSTLYTYPCAGTGGHTEYAHIWNESGTIAEAHWQGYKEDWQTITFTESFMLVANETYNYTIRTGSYPQIIHEPSLNATGGTITCTAFTDINGRIYNDWIPAIKLE
jgi:parallel beta-helix repeat protein